MTATLLCFENDPDSEKFKLSYVQRESEKYDVTKYDVTNSHIQECLFEKFEIEIFNGKFLMQRK